MDTFLTWRAEIEAELGTAAADRDAALLEQDEAERAEARSCTELLAVESALDALSRRIDAEQEIEAQGAVVLRGAPPAIARAIAFRLDEMREAARAARSRGIRARQAVDQANQQIADLRHSLAQLDLLSAPAEAGEAAA